MDLRQLDLHPDGTPGFLQAIVDTMREALVVLDADLRVQAVNHAFYQTFVVAPEETLGRPLFALGDGQWDIPQLRERLGQIVRHDGAFEDFEVTHAFPGIGQKTMLLNGRRLVHPGEGHTEHILLVMQDVTDQKEAEIELRRLQQELEERVRRRTAELEAANEELETFAYSVAHDLRAPLRTLAGFSQALIEDSAEALDDTGRDYARRIHDGADQMSRLIDDLLGLAWVSRSEMSYEPVDLSACARAIADDLAQAAPERRVTFHIQDGLVAEGDAMLLKLVLQNLLENAWKYTRPVSEAQVRFGVVGSNGHTVYYVCDNGVGFDMQYAGKLFAPFQRMHTAFEFEGNGIGLATVYRILKRHGGRIWAEAEPGRGAAFFFTLKNGAAVPTDWKRPCLKP